MFEITGAKPWNLLRFTTTRNIGKACAVRNCIFNRDQQDLRRAIFGCRNNQMIYGELTDNIFAPPIEELMRAFAPASLQL